MKWSGKQHVQFNKIYSSFLWCFDFNKHIYLFNKKRRIYIYACMCMKRMKRERIIKKYTSSKSGTLCISSIHMYHQRRCNKLKYWNIEFTNQRMCFYITIFPRSAYAKAATSACRQPPSCRSERQTCKPSGWMRLLVQSLSLSLPRVAIDPKRFLYK